MNKGKRVKHIHICFARISSFKRFLPSNNLNENQPFTSVLRLWFVWLSLLEGSHLNCFGSTIIYLIFSTLHIAALTRASVQLGPTRIIRKVEGACLAGRLPWMPDEQAPIIQQIRANSNFFRRPWFDCVQVQRLGVHGRLEQAYAEVRLLFTADVSTAGA